MSTPTTTLQIESNIQRTREEIAETTRALSEKLSPKNAWIRFRESDAGKQLFYHRGSLAMLAGGAGLLLAKAFFKKVLGGKLTWGNSLFFSSLAGLAYFERLKATRRLSSEFVFKADRSYFQDAKQILVEEAKRIESAVKEKIASTDVTSKLAETKEVAVEKAKDFYRSNPKAVHTGVGAFGVLCAGLVAWGVYSAFKKKRQLAADGLYYDYDYDASAQDELQESFEDDDTDTSFQTETFAPRETEDGVVRPPY